MKIGFVGQGWIGKHYADDFENRLYDVVRYSLEEPYIHNKEKIKECEIVFIAVPTPTTPEGFSYTPVQSALQILAPGSTAVIKSTLAPGTTEQLQDEFPDLYILHSPEFLREAMAAHDASHPDRNLIGTPKDTPEFREKAEAVLRILPEAPYKKILTSREAEIVKYAGNCFLMSKVLFMNVLYDLVNAMGASWETVRDAMIHDPRIGESHTQPVHASGHHENKETKTLRGAGGHCFIKDFEAFRRMFAEQVNNTEAQELLKAMVQFNISLLRSSGKDIDLLQQVYGEDMKLKD